MKVSIDRLKDMHFHSSLRSGEIWTGAAAAVKLIAASCASFFLALLVCTFVNAFLAEALLREQDAFASVVAGRPQSVFSSAASTPRKEVDLVPAFALSRKPSKVKDETSDHDAVPIDAMTLVGTVPPVAAWISMEGSTALVVKGQQYGGYDLAEIGYDRVVFKLGDEEFPLFMFFSGEKPPVRTAQSRTQEAPVQMRSDIQNAEFNGKDGAVSRELLHGLLMNPYEELGKLRLIPTNGGMVIESMRPDSLLNQLGVKVGDELTGVNGISIKDVPSIMNAINSMMSGTRLDFDVTRNKSSGKLGYVVK